MKINCVIVTYNRVELLKECVQAVTQQTLQVNKIIIINNNSTDDTHQYLKSISNNDNFLIINLEENIGGAGGFKEGIKHAVAEKADWTWIMDDDTIPTPTALEELVKPTTLNDKIGFVCSKAVWTDGMVHKMNVPDFSPNKRVKLPLNYYTYAANVLLISGASFVSLLVSTEAVKKVGLPIGEFFIWGDDSEFTSRMIKEGYIGLYAADSIVVHKTPENYLSDLLTTPINAIWKFKYGIRNQVYLRKRKKKNSFLFLFSALNSYRKDIRYHNRRKDEHRNKIKKMVRQAYWEGLRFSPEIEYIK